MRKKLVITLVYLLILFYIPIDKANALEVSVGFSLPGIGLPVLRGGYTHAANIGISEALQKELPISIPGIGLSLNPLFSIDLMFEILPYLAIETGAGIGITSIAAELERGSELSAVVDLGIDLIVPLMFRGQYELGRVVIYGSVGPKFKIRVGKNLIPLGIESGVVPYLDPSNIDTDSINIDTNALINDGLSLDGLTNKDGNIRDDINFSDIPLDVTQAILRRNSIILDSLLKIDLAIALGIEFRLGDANYIGLRATYDFGLDNLLEGANLSKLYIDSFAVSLTYRYAFNSKWKYY